MSKNLVDITEIARYYEGVMIGFTNFIFFKLGNNEKAHQNVLKGIFGLALWSSFSKKVGDSRFNKKISDSAKTPNRDLPIHHHQYNAEKKVTILVTKESNGLQASPASQNKNEIGVTTGLVIEPKKTLELVQKYVRLIVLAIHTMILESHIVCRYPKRIINIHSFLLPMLLGAYTYVQAYKKDTKMIDCTSYHTVEDPVQGHLILQRYFYIKEDTLDSIKVKSEASNFLKRVKLRLRDRLKDAWAEYITREKKDPDDRNTY